jgi:hypothetical protein
VRRPGELADLDGDGDREGGGDADPAWPAGEAEGGVDQHGGGDVADVTADEAAARPGVEQAGETEGDRHHTEPGEATLHG